MGFKDKFRNDYFISFRNRNNGAKIAANIHRGLEDAGYTNYYNPKQHNQEKNGYPRRLHRNVRHCKVFVWILTEDCMIAREDKPDYYFAEIIWAHKHKKCIVPIMSKAFRNNRIDNDVLKKQLYKAYNNLLKYNILSSHDKRVVDDIVRRYCTDFSIWGGHDIPEDNPLSEKIVPEIVGRISKTRGVYPLKNRWIKIPIIHMAVLLMIILTAAGIKKSIDMHDQTIWDGSTTVKGGWSSFKGDGTKEHPYKINTARQLAWLSYTSQINSFYGQYFELDADITLNPHNAKGIRNATESYIDLDGTGESLVLDKDATHNWTPIGNKDYPFSGSFDGNGHMIYGLLLKNESQDYQGLFGLCSSESRVVNVNITCATLSSSGSYIGTIVGKSEGLIDECSVYSAMVWGKKYVGGIAGEANVISNSFANAWIESSQKIKSNESGKYKGGIAGKCRYLINSSASSVLNDIEGEFVGGFAGELTKGGYNCVELGTTVSPFGGGHYMEKNVPITVCNVLGGYRGNDEKYSNIYYNEGDKMAVQFGKKHYEKLLKKYPDFFKGFDGLSFNVCSFFPFNYHDYGIDSGKYNQISKKMQIDTVTLTLNNGITDVKKNRPDIYSILSEYGEDDETLQLVEWSDSKNSKGAFANELKNSPWLKSVLDIRNKWDSAYGR